jgi:hypothetical protein
MVSGFLCCFLATFGVISIAYKFQWILPRHQPGPDGSFIDYPDYYVWSRFYHRFDQYDKTYRAVSARLLGVISSFWIGLLGAVGYLFI